MGTTSYWQRFQRERISRRRLLGTAGAGAAGLAIVTACSSKKSGTSGGTTPSATGAAGTPKRGGTYRETTTGAWGTINPLTSVAFGPGILPRMYNSLVLRSPRQPNYFYQDLAAKYEQPDPSTYVFTLRADAKIAPNTLGVPERALDSSDCVAWLDAIKAAKTAVAKRFTDQWLDSYSASSPTEFTMKTKGPYAYFFNTLNTPVGGTIPPKEMLSKDMNAQGVGAGPFVLRDGSYVEAGSAKLDRNRTTTVRTRNMVMRSCLTWIPSMCRSSLIGRLAASRSLATRSTCTIRRRSPR